MGRLWPAGTVALQRADDIEGVKVACDSVVEYRGFFEQGSGGAAGKSLEDHFFEREAQLNKLAFLQQVMPLSFLGSHLLSFGLVLARLMIVPFCDCICVFEVARTGNTVPRSFCRPDM